MSKCIIYAFSGTGNSLLICDLLKAHLERKHDVDVTIYRIRFPIDKIRIPNPNDYDFVGFSYPIYGFNVPKPFNDFIKLLPKSATPNKSFFIVKNSGEPFAVNNASSAHFVGIMKKKGYQPTLEHHYLMTYNIMFRYPNNLAKQMYLYDDALLSLMAEDIVLKKQIKIKYNPFYRLLSCIVRVVWLAGPINSKLTYVDKKRCIDCGLCITNCPMNAIYKNKDNKYKLHANCCICMACAFNCPRDAFKMGILNPWRINGRFNIKAILNNNEYNGKEVNAKTKGYFKNFKKHFKKQNELLLKRGYKLPVDYSDEEMIK